MPCKLCTTAFGKPLDPEVKGAATACKSILTSVSGKTSTYCVVAHRKCGQILHIFKQESSPIKIKSH